MLETHPGELGAVDRTSLPTASRGVSDRRRTGNAIRAPS